MTCERNTGDDDAAAVFRSIDARIASSKSSVIELHLGKTAIPPNEKLMQPDVCDLQAAIQEYASPIGIAPLRKLIQLHQHSRFGYDVADDRVLVTAGGTHGLSCAVHAVAADGGEVLVCSPHWLFAPGVIAAAGGVAVEVPIFVQLSSSNVFDFISVLEQHVTPRTRAVYFNTPNNPTGYAFSRAQVQSLVEFARARRLWLIADNAYENFDFSADGFVDPAASIEGADITFSVFTFSKTYSMPGCRVGYLIAPCSASDRVRSAALFGLYAVSTASQQAACKALRDSTEELRRRHLQVRKARDLAVELLTVPHLRVAGGFYLFLCLDDYRDGAARNFIDDCLEAGVSLAPGSAFGTECKSYARLCFAAVQVDELARAIETINDVYNSETERRSRSAVR